MSYAEVVVDVSSSELDKVFDYIIPANLENAVKVGSFVFVPFGGRTCFGFVLKIKDDSEYDKDKLKQIFGLARSDVFLNNNQIELVDKMCQKFFLRKIDVLRLFLPPDIRKDKNVSTVEQFAKVIDNDKLDKFQPKQNAKNQVDLKAYLIENNIEKVSFLNKEFGNSSVKSFVAKGLVELFEEKKKQVFDKLDLGTKTIVLSENQKEIIETIESKNNTTFLLHGVTGSGKTEVYLQLIRHALNEGKTAIMLVPEISLTPQIYSRFEERFGNLVAVLHSGLTPTQKYIEWERIHKGEAKVVVGARSAIFAPLNNIGIIVIDEEHDSSYISESNPRYFTHDVAKFRSSIEKANLVLGSATPSIETYHKTKTKEIELLEMPNRIGESKMPEIEIVDMSEEILRGNTGIFSLKLISELQKTIELKKQAIVFINRRGFSSFLRCSKCGYVPKCESCDVSLVYHKVDGELKCHFCGKRYKSVNVCDKCGNNEMRNGGVGSQRIVEELRQMFPKVKILRLDNDTTETKAKYVEILQEFASTTPAILVGTQMVAKGHDFENVNLVGIVDADLSLHFADYRSTERTFQLVTQVAGRAGRSKDLGKCILQTYSKNHFVYKFSKANNYKDFYEKEENLREVTKFPPFTTVYRILVSSVFDDLARNTLKKIYNKMQELKEEYPNNFVYLDAMKSPVKRIQDKYRYQILLRLQKNEDKILCKMHEIVLQNSQKGVIMFVETNPQNLS